MNEKINVVFCIDAHYSQHLGVALASLFMHNIAGNLRVFIVSSKLDAEDLNRLSYIGKTFGAELVFKKILDDRIANFRQHLHISRAMYFRLLLPDILAGENKVIYLDCDLVVEANLEDLWHTDVTSYGCAGVDEGNPAQTARLGLDPDFYINAGVLVLNLAYWRRHDIIAGCTKWLEANPYKSILLDQDAINVVLRG